jgi:SP family sugar porter-like MFS transporter
LIVARLGQKRILFIAALLFLASAIGTASASDLLVFCTFRAIGGIAIGLSSNVSPMYIAELAPSQHRGKLVSLNQLAIVTGILAAQLMNLLIAESVPENVITETITHSWNVIVGWRWMFGVEAIPAAVFLILLFFIPESPRWLVMSGRKEEAEQLLSSIAGEEFARNEIENILATMPVTTRTDSQSSDQRETAIGKILALGLFLAMFQQWCGINVIFNYAHEIFSAADYSIGETMFNIVVTGVVNLVFTIVAMMTVDRVGRRRLMLLGAGGLAVIYSALGACYYLDYKGILVLSLVVSAIACYAMTLAPVTWIIISEIFPNRLRGGCIAICVLALWIACTLLTLTYPWLSQQFGTGGTFWLYAIVSFVGLGVIHRCLPETKQKSLEQLENDL